MTPRIALTTQAHHIIQSVLNKGDYAIDATVGNGHDTSFLINQVGKQGKVFGFDIQQKAIEISLKQLEIIHNPSQFKLINACHSQMDQHVPLSYHGKIKVIMFNLGYLPNADKTIITQTKSTISAINKAVDLVPTNGLISIMAYPGHTGGAEETESIIQWSRQLPSQQYTFQQINCSEKATAPRLFIIRKITE